jgi:hypothetical protein
VTGFLRGVVVVSWVGLGVFLLRFVDSGLVPLLPLIPLVVWLWWGLRVSVRESGVPDDVDVEWLILSPNGDWKGR